MLIKEKKNPDMNSSLSTPSHKPSVAFDLNGFSPRKSGAPNGGFQERSSLIKPNIFSKFSSQEPEGSREELSGSNINGESPKGTLFQKSRMSRLALLVKKHNLGK